MFCPKCGAILIPKKSDGKKVMACSSCGHINRNISSVRITEEISKETENLEPIDESVIETLPKTPVECNKCSNREAYFWLVQTRASDEPETKFLKCTKCGHTWRDYD